MSCMRHVACVLGGFILAMLLGSSPAMADSLPPASWMDPPIWLHPISRTPGLGRRDARLAHRLRSRPVLL